MLRNQPTSRRPSKASRKPFCPIRRLNLNAERSQDVDAPGCAGGAVFFVLRHGRGDFRVDQPMPRGDIVVVAAGADTLDYEGFDLFDAGELEHGGRLRGGMC